MAITHPGHNLIKLTEVGDQIPLAGTEVGLPPALPREEIWVSNVSLICGSGGLFEITDINGNVVLSHTVAAGDTVQFPRADHKARAKWNGLIVTALPADSSIILEV